MEEGILPPGTAFQLKTVAASLLWVTSLPCRLWIYQSLTAEAMALKPRLSISPFSTLSRMRLHLKCRKKCAIFPVELWISSSLRLSPCQTALSPPFSPFGPAFQTDLR